MTFQPVEASNRESIWCLVDNCSQVHINRHPGMLHSENPESVTYLFTATGQGARFTATGNMVINVEVDAKPGSAAASSQPLPLETYDLHLAEVHVVPDLPAQVVLSISLLEDQGWVLMEGQYGLKQGDRPGPAHGQGLS